MKIGLIGFGNIGQGVEELVYKQKSALMERFGQALEVKKILIKDLSKERKAFDENIVFTDNIDDLINDSEIEALVEVTATVDEAFAYMSRALKAGKHVITANKAVVSAYFEELSELAHEAKKGFLYEASVGGGVHIIKSIHEDLHLNKIKYIRGILNGTCNFILSKLEDEAIEYEYVLKEAQMLGFAEPDPSADVDGIDSQRKTRILSSLILGGKVVEDDIDTFGISNISSKDIEIFKEHNLSVKLIGEGKLVDEKAFATVMPSLFPKSAIFSNIKSSTNMISYYGDNIYEVSFVGPGAGRYPTADAILRDLVDAMEDSYISGNPLKSSAISLSNAELEAIYYVRLPKSISYTNLAENLYDLEDENAFFTKKVKLSEILELIEGLDKNQFFLAKIIEEEV